MEKNWRKIYLRDHVAAHNSSMYPLPNCSIMVYAHGQIPDKEMLVWLDSRHKVCKKESLLLCIVKLISTKTYQTRQNRMCSYSIPFF